MAMVPTYSDLIDAAATALLLSCGSGGEAATLEAADLLLQAVQTRYGLAEAYRRADVEAVHADLFEQLRTRLAAAPIGRAAAAAGMLAGLLRAAARVC
jgi:hypothetical protein